VTIENSNVPELHFWHPKSGFPSPNTYVDINLYIINNTTQNYSTQITLHGESAKIIPRLHSYIMIKDFGKFSKDFKIVVHAEMY
jgi:hypothetical protein